MADWLIGAGLSLLGSVLSNLGLNLQKLTHIRAQKEHARLLDEETDDSAGDLYDDSDSDDSGDDDAQREAKQATAKKKKKKKKKQKKDAPYACKPLWILGFSLVVIGAIGDFVVGSASALVVFICVLCTLRTHLTMNMQLHTHTYRRSRSRRR
jgi:hypothetical protein